MHRREEVGIDAGSNWDDGIDAAPWTECRLADAQLVFVDPLIDFRRRKDRPAVEASDEWRGLDGVSMAGALRMLCDRVRSGVHWSTRWWRGSRAAHDG